jgi:hypothetical protein
MIEPNDPFERMMPYDAHSGPYLNRLCEPKAVDAVSEMEQSPI